ncbi:MAG: response regulator [Deltaproteobacteria bacterium]|nr:response regulator [Deltaproteobacteria bacterium]
MSLPQVPGRASAAVLVVDDDPLVLRTMARQLSRQFQVETAADAASALERCRRRSFAVVVTDYRMPDHDGLWLLEQVRRDWPDAGRMLVSGSPPADLDVHLSSGLVQGFVRKPFELGELGAGVGRVLGEAGGRGAGLAARGAGTR